METFEPKKEAQIWQRVFSQPEFRGSAVHPLLLSSMEATAAYRQLANVLTGTQKELAKRLLQEEQATFDTLRGLSRLAGKGWEEAKSLPAPKAQTGRLLETCYHRAKKAAAEYTARSAEPEFGLVFQRLAKRQGEHCALIARLLGSLKP